MNGDKIRLFVALSVPDELKAQIRLLPATLLDFKSRTHPSDLHITLRFLGDTDASLVEPVEQALAAIRGPAAFNAEISGLAMFGKKDKAVLYAAVQSVRKMALLADSVSSKLEPLGFTPEAKPYFPHMTIARLKDERNIDAYARRFGASIKCRWKVSAFHLMKSASADSGHKRYSVLRSFDLPPY